MDRHTAHRLKNDGFSQSFFYRYHVSGEGGIQAFPTLEDALEVAALNDRPGCEWSIEEIWLKIVEGDSETLAKEKEWGKTKGHIMRM